MTVRDRLLGSGYHLLYNQLSWSYDAVAWLVSKGDWRHWGEVVRPWLGGPRVLDVGCGPGHLLAGLAAQGYQLTGVDRSRTMIDRAGRNLAREGLPARLVRGRAQALPFHDETFDVVVMTFPAGFVFEAATRREVWRVLGRGGRWLIVDSARLAGDGPWARLVNLAFRLTSVRLPIPVLEAVFMGGPLPAGLEVEPEAPPVQFEFTWRDERTQHGAARLLIATRPLI